MGSGAETKICAVYENAKEAIPLINAVLDMENPHPSDPNASIQFRVKGNRQQDHKTNMLKRH